jgi:hypothetical protein
MALILKDRVLESSTSTGTGSFTLTGAQTGYQSFSAIGNGNTTYYTIQGKNPDGTLTGEWEVGIGTWSTGNTLSRDTVLSNSLGTTAKIVFSAGAKDVFCDYPASKSVNQNADNKVIIPYTSGVTNVGSLNVGDATAHTDSGVIAAFTASEPLYLYTSLQNTSSANTSYASYAVNDGGHTSYGELGINNSNYSYTAAGFPNNTFSAPLATFVESYGGPLAIGTWDSQKISFIVNGSVNTADAMTINASGTINIPSLTASQAVFTDASKNLVSKAVTGTGSVVLDNAPTLNNINVTGGAYIAGNFYVEGGNTASAVQIADNSSTGFVDIGSTFQTGAITLGKSTAAQTVNIATGVTAASTTKAVNIGTAGNATSTTNIAIGSATGTSTTTIKGAVTLSATTQALNLGDSQTTGAITIGGASATGALTLGQSTGSQNINIGDGFTSTSIINIGARGVSTGNISIGRSQATQSILIGSSATGSTVTSGNTRTIEIGTTSVGTGISNIFIGKPSITVNHTTTIYGRYININANTTLSLISGGALNIGQNLAQTTCLVDDLPFLIGVVVGSRAFVTDAYGPIFGSVVSGGGSTAVPVYYTGTQWRVG